MFTYDISGALKLGTITGFILGILFSFIMSAILFSMRKVQRKVKSKSVNSKFIKDRTIERKTEKKIKTKKEIQKTFIFLMDKELTFNILIQSIIDQNLGEIEKRNLKKGILAIYNQDDEVSIEVSKLTKHTSEVSILSNGGNHTIKEIIDYTKIKEYSFLNY
jgi:mannitol-specific phosphotransferase system IIBC component